jgi:CheY-like chemotaxis protein
MPQRFFSLTSGFAAAVGCPALVERLLGHGYFEREQPDERVQKLQCRAGLDFCCRKTNLDTSTPSASEGKSRTGQQLGRRNDMNELRSILLAEDNADEVEQTLAGLTKLNLANDIVVARDGAEALDYLHCRGKYAARNNGNPAVVLLDLEMPKVDGLEVLREIKSNQNFKSIPVVMITSSTQENDLARSDHLGVNAYVVKPVNYRDFVSAVRQVGAFWAVVNEPPPEAMRKPN